jgi:hypothetical protein
MIIQIMKELIISGLSLSSAFVVDDATEKIALPGGFFIELGMERTGGSYDWGDCP